MVVRKFATTRRVLCASPEYLKRYGTPKEIEELSQHRCINMRNWVTGKIMPWTFRKAGKAMANDVAARLVTNDGDCELQAALSGAGIAQVTTYRVAPYVRSKQLQLLLVEYASDRYNYYIYMPRRKQIPKKNRALADFLFRELRVHPDLIDLQTLSALEKK